MKEAAILNKLAAADPEDKKHLIRLEKTFDHRGHLCMVFESMRWVLLSTSRTVFLFSLTRSSLA